MKDNIKNPWLCGWVVVVSYLLLLGVITSLGALQVQENSPGFGRGSRLSFTHGVTLHFVAALMLLRSLELRVQRIHSTWFFMGIATWFAGDLLMNESFILKYVTLLYYVLFVSLPTYRRTRTSDSANSSMPARSHGGE